MQHYVRCISPIFFEAGIQNLMCGCILGWGSVAYHFRVTVTLTLLLTVKAVTLIFMSGRGSAMSSAKEGKSGPIYNLSKR